MAKKTMFSKMNDRKRHFFQIKFFRNIFIFFFLAALAFFFLYTPGNKLWRKSYISSKYSCHDCNVIIIVIDALRSDHVGCYGYFRDTTPNIDHLAKDSIIFKNAYSPASSTRPAMASLMTSKLPTEHMIYGGSSIGYLKNKFYTIQEFFNEKKYLTAAFVSSSHFKFNILKNFQEQTYFKTNARILFEEASRWIDNNKENSFFLFIHAREPHNDYIYHPFFSITPELSPYRVLKKFFPIPRSEMKLACESRDKCVVLNQEQIDEMKANYDGEIAYADHYLGLMLNDLKKKGLFEKSVIIILADHGEEFLDHGGYWHGCTLYDELLRIPLIVYLPGGKGVYFTEKVSLIDIFPTLVEIFGAESDHGDDFTGQSLWPLITHKDWEEKPILSATAIRGYVKHSLIKGDYKLIKNTELNKIIGLFNLKEDPYEQNDLQNVKPWLTRKLEDSLSRYTRCSTPLLPRFKESSGCYDPDGDRAFDSNIVHSADALDKSLDKDFDVTAEDLEELRSLGYLQ